MAFAEREYKAIVEFQVGDLVYVADDITLKSWSQRTVQFSFGTGSPGAHNTMLKVTFGLPPGSDYLLVNRTQLFLTPDGLIPAAALVPGKHQLTTANGTMRPVISLEVGEFKKGMHHIATSTGAAKSPNGHLILAKGVVCGDWALQVAMATPSVQGALPLVAGLDSLPEFGTKAYTETYPELTHKEFRVNIADISETALAEAQPNTDEFEPYDAANTAYVPQDAFAFFTPDQAWDIARYAPTYTPASGAGKALLAYQFKLFGAFYPDIDFFYDERQLMPNAYIFEEYGRMHVLLTGGLARLECLSFQGLATVIATMVGAITGGPPRNSSGLSCLGTASYGGVAGVLPEVWIGLQSTPIITQGIAQITELFSYITEPNRGGSDTCMNVSCDCRIEAMKAAYQLLPLPHCAGGPPDPALEVTAATSRVGVPHDTFTVTFNLPVDPVTAIELGNYGLEPPVAAYSAQVSKEDPSTVEVAANLARDTEYTLTVVGVLSIEQQPLLPDKNVAVFHTAS
ncbi:hypothetical protein WJ45_20130 [Burkholderia ubonensis]|nr:hypothetical protein WJ45_20130 [Burkholderia ubonensis]KVQ44354.1 hypothetical protein WK04_15635 [Burkholderia ubonensis]